MTLSSENIPELAARWKKARISAAKALMGSPVDTDDEVSVLRALPQDKQELLLKAVFDNSRRLGLSCAKHFGGFLKLEDVRAIFPKLDSVCLSGDWHQRESAVVREKSGCCDGLKIGSFFCDYWREASDGLTMGLSENVYFVRHGSSRHSDERCIDVWFEEKADVNRQTMKGALPDWAKPRLGEIEKKFSEIGIDLKFEGAAEGNLFYQLSSAKKPSCSDQGNWEEKIAKEVLRFWPGVTLKNTTPVAVYGDRL